jgi:hypothetical protein
LSIAESGISVEVSLDISKAKSTFRSDVAIPPLLYVPLADAAESNLKYRSRLSRDISRSLPVYWVRYGAMRMSALTAGRGLV